MGKSEGHGTAKTRWVKLSYPEQRLVIDSNRHLT